jgi:hypothetical protein
MLGRLNEENVVQILLFIAPTDLEKLCEASKTVWFEVAPKFQIWKQLFLYKWHALNYPLLHVEKPLVFDQNAPNSSATSIAVNRNEIKLKQKPIFPLKLHHSQYELLRPLEKKLQLNRLVTIFVAF